MVHGLLLQSRRPRGELDLASIRQQAAGSHGSVLPGGPVCTLAFMRLETLPGSWEEVPWKSKKTKWPLRKSFPFLRVLALIQHDNGCSRVCATVNPINRGTLQGPPNETPGYQKSRSLGLPVSLTVCGHSEGFQRLSTEPSVSQTFSKSSLISKGTLLRKEVLVKQKALDSELLLRTAVFSHSPLHTSTSLLFPPLPFPPPPKPLFTGTS